MRAYGFSIIGLCFVSLSMFGLTAAAETPDEQTPAEESVCDPLKEEDVTKGLYGLCIAFCEAQDLDEYLKVNAVGSELPGDRILENYERKRTSNDPDMPCLVQASACPCFNTQLCTDSGGNKCQIKNVSGPADIFPQDTCDNTDRCENFPGNPVDTCTQSSPSITSTVNVFVSPNQGFCLAGIGTSAGTQQNFVTPLDDVTAQICLDELNAFDMNDSGTVEPCGLAGN